MDAVMIQQRLADVRGRIQKACDRVGRNPNEITLIAVSKTFPETVLLTAHTVGLHHFGENKAQEFERKYDALSSQLGPEVTWHFIGHLQRNKVKMVAGKASLIHGVDSLRLARALQRHAENEELALECLVQLNVSGEDSKFGMRPSELPDFLREIRALDRIEFKGLMTLATPTSDEERLRTEFGQMRESLVRCRNSLESMAYLSMGMTSDFEIAIEEGATHVRIGSALFGQRAR